MRYYLFLIIFSFSIFGSKAQSNLVVKNKKVMNLSFLTNKKIKYSIVLMSCDSCIPISNIGYRVIVELSKNEQVVIKHLTPGKWIELLTNSATDYYTNLILYSIYNKDAFILSQNDSKELWKKYLRKKDLEYWKQHLK